VLELDEQGFVDLLRTRTVHAAETAAYAGEALLARDQSDREALHQVFGLKLPKIYEYDPVLFYRRISGANRVFDLNAHPRGQWKLRTNNYGMRNDQDVVAEWDGPRILVTGDSHIDGVCSNDESLAGVLARSLEAPHRPVVEVLNAGVGGYSMYNYLGVLERYAQELHPDVFVAVVYGGTITSGRSRSNATSCVDLLGATRPTGRADFPRPVEQFRKSLNSWSTS